MKSYSSIAFLIAALLYSLLLAGGYGLLNADLKTTDPVTVKVNVVPVTLSMFQMPEITPKTIEEPVVQTLEVVKEVVEKVIEEPTLKSMPTIKNKTATKVVSSTVIPKITPPKKIAQPTLKPNPPVAKPLTKSIPAERPPRAIETNPTALESQAIAPQFSQQQIASAEQSYLSELRKLIGTLAQDTYPSRAQRRQWEGVVTLSFTLLPSGKIQGLTIKESSGRQILDDAATSILQEKMNNQFLPFPEEIKRTNWAITLPVSYNLR